MSDVRKINWRTVINRVREIMEHMISKKQGEFKVERGSADQIFPLRMLLEKCIEKG